MSRSVSDRRELKNKLCSEFEFILAWFAFDYLYNEYEITEISEQAWQFISDALSGITAFDDSVNDIYQALDNAVYTINHDSDLDFWVWHPGQVALLGYGLAMDGGSTPLMPILAK